ncbi:MAG: YCF48-related protein, partial [Ignavibacteria bacterium]
MSHFTKLSIAIMLFLVSFAFAQAPVDEYSIKFTGTHTAMLVGADGIIMKTTNNGIVWEEQTSNVTNLLLGNSSKNGLSVVAGENGVILRSVDNGANWDVIIPGTLENLNDAEVLDFNHAVVCGDNGIILVTSDAGLTWDSSSSVVSINLKDIKFVSSSVGFITGDLGTLLKSVDGGLSWSEIDMSFTNNSFNAIEAIDEYNLVLVGDLGTVFLSNNGGESWFGPSGVTYEDNFNDVVFFSSNDGVIAGDNGLILKTVDGGYTWAPAVMTFLGQYDLYSVAFEDINYGISIGKDGMD